MVLGSAQDPKKYDMRIHSPYNFLVDSVKIPINRKSTGSLTHDV
jgi:hypothetical protein